MRQLKLVLTLETLKSLSEAQVEQIQGGAYTVPAALCHPLTITACRPSCYC